MLEIWRPGFNIHGLSVYYRDPRTSGAGHGAPEIARDRGSSGGGSQGCGQGRGCWRGGQLHHQETQVRTHRQFYLYLHGNLER